MKTTILEIVLLLLYFPLTIFYLLCGTLLENPQIITVAQWFEFRFCGYVLPVLGLLTFPCLIAAIRLRKKGRCRVAAWLSLAPLLAFAGLFAMCYLLRWICG